MTIALTIREADPRDWEYVWPFFEQIVSAGQTYAFERQTDKETGRRLWFEAPRKAYIAILDDNIVGTYYLRTNHAGPGSHVCNCGYMVAPAARGQGVASAMCKHSQQEAVSLGYLAMQFNYVASSNTGAIRLWQRLGFEIAGRLPHAFRHPDSGLIDAYIMYKFFSR